MHPRKAIIPSAGLGTRFLPASKAVPKVLLPVVDRPLIQYAVEEAARAGIEEVCIVVSPGQEAVERHFLPDPGLEAMLSSAGKEDLAGELAHLDGLGGCRFVVQEEPLGLGHAVLAAREFAGEEPFVVLLPDEIFDPRLNYLGTLMDLFHASATSVMVVHEVPPSQIHLYGAIACEDPAEDPLRVSAVVEKPAAGAAPSNLAAVGRYVLDPGIFDVLAGLEPGAGGEIQLADGLDRLGRAGRMLAHRHTGRRWDVGNKQGYLQACVSLAAEREDLGDEFRSFLGSLCP